MINPTPKKKQQVGNEKRILCQQIIGQQVWIAFMNGDLPHNVAVAWTSSYSAWLVNLKTNKCIEYIRTGQYILRKPARSYDGLHIIRKAKQIPLLDVVFTPKEANNKTRDKEEYFSQDRMDDAAQEYIEWRKEEKKAEGWTKDTFGWT